MDILRRCVQCGRPFLFFAQEQKHWYETLGFDINADCVRCTECRRSLQTLKKRFHRYQNRIVAEFLDDEELSCLVDDAVFLVEAGLLRDINKLGRLKNLAVRRLPNHKSTLKIVAAVAKARRIGV